jgi:hypothetical protein
LLIINLAFLKLRYSADRGRVAAAALQESASGAADQVEAVPAKGLDPAAQDEVSHRRLNDSEYVPVAAA